MPALSRTQAAWLLWVAALLLVPMPYMIIGEGSVPVVRFALLGVVSTAYAALVDGSGVAWPLTALLLLHVLLSAGLLAIVAYLLASALPARSRFPTVAVMIAVGFVIALQFDVYRTPFDDAAIHSNWIGLFQ